MINPSLIYDTSESQNESLISAVRRQQSNGKNPARRSSSIEAHWSNETVEKLEKILVDHRNQIETNPESDDDQHRVLIFRLIDLVRRSSTTNQRKSENLDKLFEDIIEIRRRNRFRMESTKQKPVEQQQIQDLLDDTNRLQLLIERQQEKILELTSLLNIRTEQPPSTMRHPIEEPRIIRNQNREGPFLRSRLSNFAKILFMF